MRLHADCLAFSLVFPVPPGGALNLLTLFLTLLFPLAYPLVQPRQFVGAWIVEKIRTAGRGGDKGAASPSEDRARL